jgi:sugar phosphate isomerase/epimerase
VTTTRRRFLASAAASAAAAAFSPLSTAREAFALADSGGAKPRRFDLGLVTYNVVKDWDLDTILRVCREVGIVAVELRTTHAHGVEPSLDAARRAEVKKRLGDSGVRFWGCGSTCEFHSPDPQVVRNNIEECKRFVGLVADLAGAGVKVRPNGLPKEVPVEKTIEQIGASLVECGKAARDAGVEIWVEVHGAATQEPANMKSIMEHCGYESVGVTWNSNGTDVKNGSVAESFAMLRPWIRSCHINDLGNDAAGTYPYRELFGLLRDAGYDRYTLIEIGTPYPDVAAGEAFLREYRQEWERLSAG